MFKLYKKYKASKARKKAILEEYIRQTNQFDNDVRFYNWWPVEDYTTLWLYRFVKNNGLLEGFDKPLNFCSLFGDRDVLNYVNDGVKIFFSGENLHSPHWAHYSDGLLNDEECKLSIGFDYYDNPRYLRFPLWLTYAFEPTMDVKQIKERCEQLRYPIVGERQKFASLIAHADMDGTRAEMYQALSAIGKIDCPSDLFHNDDSLKNHYADDKLSYLRNYLFNVCPENSNADGYCTEKIFDAIAAGCIPIYWGSDNMPEPTVLNPEAIIFWNKETKGKNAIKQIRELYSRPDSLEAFLKQPRLVDGAEQEVLRMINELNDCIVKLLA